MALEPSGPTDAHRYVLELLGTEPSVDGSGRFELSPVCIARNTGYRDQDHVSAVCRELADADLITQTDSPGTYYRITWRGQAYVAGELRIEADRLSAQANGGSDDADADDDRSDRADGADGDAA
jgi:hypothetical protein